MSGRRSGNVTLGRASTGGAGAAARQQRPVADFAPDEQSDG